MTALMNPHPAAIAATLVFSTPDLAEAMCRQIPDIVVVDNGSHPPIDGAEVRTTTNQMFTGGWNYLMRFAAEDLLDDTQAVRNADTWSPDYIWMLNSDVEGVSPDMMRSLAQAAWGGSYAVLTPAFNSPHSVFAPNPDLVMLRRPRPVAWVDWTCPMVSLDAWRDVGGFDERLPGYFADIDWCYRAAQKGYRFGVCDWLQVKHLGSVTAQRVGHVWNADDSYLRSKWGKGWIDLVGEMAALMRV